MPLFNERTIYKSKLLHSRERVYIEAGSEHTIAAQAIQG